MMTDKDQTINERILTLAAFDKMITDDEDVQWAIDNPDKAVKRIVALKKILQSVMKE